MKQFSTSTLAKIGVLAGIGFILSLFEFVLPIFPSFLKLDIGIMPAVIGSLTLGPVAGVCIELVRNLIDISKTSSGGIGQLANFIMGSSLVIPMGILYKRSQNARGYIIGALLGMVLMAIVACPMNYFVLIPMYSRFIPIDAIIELAKAINPIVVDMRTFILFVIVPFNLLKGAIIFIIGFVLYKALKPVLGSLMEKGKLKSNARNLRKI